MTARAKITKIMDFMALSIPTKAAPAKKKGGAHGAGAGSTDTEKAHRQVRLALTGRI